jgi:hypothetical protein
MKSLDKPWSSGLNGAMTGGLPLSNLTEENSLELIPEINLDFPESIDIKL